VKSSIIKVLILTLFVSFISIGGGTVNSFAQQKDEHKEKIQTPGQKPLPKHKKNGQKKNNKHNKKKHKHNKQKHKHHNKHKNKHHRK